MENGVSDAESTLLDGGLGAKPSFLSDGELNDSPGHRAGNLIGRATNDAEAKEDEGGGWSVRGGRGRRAGVPRGSTACRSG